MHDEDFLNDSFEFKLFFDIIHVDFFENPKISLLNQPKVLSVDLLKNYLNNETLSKDIESTLFLSHSKALLKINANLKKFLIIERHLFSPNKLLLTEIFIDDYEYFLSLIQIYDPYLDNKDENFGIIKKSENVNVLGFLDQVCKTTKEAIMNIDFTGCDETFVMQMGFYKDISTSDKKKTRKEENRTLKEVDPKVFFIDEYYNLLYGACFSLKNSTINNNEKLTRFIKVQVKHLLYKYCKQTINNNVAQEGEKMKTTTNTILYKTVIENSAMSDADIEFKYKTPNLMYKDKQNKILNEYEYQFDLKYQRNGFILKNWNISLLSSKKDQNGNQQDEEVIETLKNIFKIRELQLQIIVYLELMTFTNLDSNFTKFDEIYSKPETRKRSKGLYGNKPKHKSKTKENSKDIAELDLCQKLNILVNKLCVAESLISKSLIIDAHEQEVQNELNLNKHNFKLSNKKKLSEIPPKLIINWYLKNCLFNEKSDESLLGFYNTCMIPVYKKRLPKCLNFFKPKFVGTSFDRSLSGENDSSNYEIGGDLKKLRQEPNKNLKELLNSDVSLLQRQESTFASTQERVKLLEKRITSLDNKSKSYTQNQTKKAIKRSHSTLISEPLISKNILNETPTKSNIQMIEINGEKFKRAKLKTNQVSFLRTGSSRTVSLLDRLAQTFNEPGEFSHSSLDRDQNGVQSVEQKGLMEDLFNKFSQRANNNFNESDNGSDMAIQATPQKMSEMIQSPMKSHIMSSGIKSSASKVKKSPLSGVILSSGGRDIDNSGVNDVIESPMIKNNLNYSNDNNILSSSPWKTPRIGAIEEEHGQHMDDTEQKIKVKRKLFSFDE